MEPYFFFSYAHRDRGLCDGPPRDDGDRQNFLDDLFDDLCKRVSAIVAKPRDEVGYRDRERLAIGDRWSGELADKLRISRVLVALVTPNFLDDPHGNCGREFNVFVERFNLLREAENDPGPYRIVPIFWENADDCWRHATKSAKQLLNTMQHSQAELPNDYPHCGLHRLRRTRPFREYDSFIFVIGQRIVELANQAPLPTLPGDHDFKTLPSAFRLTKEDEATQPSTPPVRNLAELKLTHQPAAPARVPGLKSPSGGLP